MKKKVLALTLTAALALSSTAAFAADTNCNKVTAKYDFNNLLKNYSSNYDKANANSKITVNGKTVNLNDLKGLLNKKLNNTAEVKEETPAVSVPKTEKPVAEEPVVTQPEVNTPVAEKPSESTETEKNNTAVSSYEQKVVELVNVERQKAGLPALTLDAEISNVARIKSKDMADNNYFAHQSPTYGSAGDMLSKFGIKWSAWGENIASGQKTPEAVVNAWMNSSGHRANILSSNYSRLGVGYVTNSNGTPYWTQMFAN